MAVRALDFGRQRYRAISAMPLSPPIFATRSASDLVLSRVLRLSSFVLLVAVATSAHARGPDPPQRIPMEPLGYQSIATRYLLEGATMLTLDYVDNQHLLVTFGVAKLMPRLPDCPEDDEDRTIRAVLLELPTGRELAHTEWRVHDLGQYLWNVGDGHFLLRKRDVLTAFSPIQDLASGNPFTERPFLHFDRRIQAIIVSANNDLLSIETVKRTAPRPQAAFAAQSPAQSQSQTQSQPPTRKTGLQRRNPNELRPDPTPVEVSFIRIMRLPIVPEAPFGADPIKQDSTKLGPAAPRGIRLMGRLDGRIYTSTAVNVPLTTEGFLRAKTTTNHGVLLDFLTFTGKDIDLGDFTTSCPPRPTFVSPSEFVAFGCRGDAQSLDLAGFNLKGDFLWQINFTDEQAYPYFATAVPSGRFAFSRTITATHVFGNETPSMSQLEDQEVRVIQMYNGRQLLRAVASPIQRAGQNFTLSPNGMGLAVIHDIPTVKGDVTTHHTSIEVYALPTLSDKDAAQVKLETAMAPAPSDVHFRFSDGEIKASLREKPEHEDSTTTSSADSPSDSRIVGDSIPATSPPPTSATGIIPASDPPPACANFTEAGSTPETACPVAPPAKPAPSTGQDTTESAPEKRRKPPTLYEPTPATPPTASPQ